MKKEERKKEGKEKFKGKVTPRSKGRRQPAVSKEGRIQLAGRTGMVKNQPKIRAGTHFDWMHADPGCRSAIQCKLSPACQVADGVDVDEK